MRYGYLQIIHSSRFFKEREKKCIVRKSNKKRKCNKKTIKKERKEKIIVSRKRIRKYEEILMKNIL